MWLVFLPQPFFVSNFIILFSSPNASLLLNCAKVYYFYSGVLRFLSYYPHPPNAIVGQMVKFSDTLNFASFSLISNALKLIYFKRGGGRGRFMDILYIYCITPNNPDHFERGNVYFIKQYPLIKNLYCNICICRKFDINFSHYN